MAGGGLDFSCKSCQRRRVRIDQWRVKVSTIARGETRRWIARNIRTWTSESGVRLQEFEYEVTVCDGVGFSGSGSKISVMIILQEGELGAGLSPVIYTSLPSPLTP